MSYAFPMQTRTGGCRSLVASAMYAIADGCIVVLEVFNKTTQETPDRVIRNCQRRLRAFLDD